VLGQCCLQIARGCEEGAQNGRPADNWGLG
jgi:hypothetical protein